MRENTSEQGSSACKSGACGLHITRSQYRLGGEYENTMPVSNGPRGKWQTLFLCADVETEFGTPHSSSAHAGTLEHIWALDANAHDETHEFNLRFFSKSGDGYGTLDIAFHSDLLSTSTFERVASHIYNALPRCTWSERPEATT